MVTPKAITLAAIILLTGTSFGQTIQTHTDKVPPIEPPFGLEWGENKGNTIKWAKDNRFPARTGTDKTGREVLEIEGPFPKAEFNRLRFYFSSGQLTETEIQFHEVGNNNQGETEFAAFTKALAIKSQVDAQLGRGQLIRNEKGKENGKEWQFIQQIWTDEEHAVWLSVFSAKSPQKGAMAVTSLHYRWEKRILDKKMDKKDEASP